MPWTQIMLGDPSFGEDVPQLMGHEHVVQDLRSAGGALDIQEFGDGPHRYGRMKSLARAGWGMLNEDLKVTAKLHGPLPLGHVSALGGTFHTDSPEHSTRGQSVHLRVDPETHRGAHRRDRAAPHSLDMGEGSRNNGART